MPRLVCVFCTQLLINPSILLTLSNKSVLEYVTGGNCEARHQVSHYGSKASLGYLAREIYKWVNIVTKKNYNCNLSGLSKYHMSIVSPSPNPPPLKGKADVPRVSHYTH